MHISHICFRNISKLLSCKEKRIQLVLLLLFFSESLYRYMYIIILIVYYSVMTHYCYIIEAHWLTSTVLYNYIAKNVSNQNTILQNTVQPAIDNLENSNLKMYVFWYVLFLEIRFFLSVIVLGCYHSSSFFQIIFYKKKENTYTASSLWYCRNI